MSIDASYIHTLHLSFGFFDTSMPPRIAAHIQALRDENPDWTLRIWGPVDSRALVAQNHPDSLALYDSFPAPIQRSDLSRYAILYAHGGVYADLDYLFMVSLTQVFDGAFAGPGVQAFVNQTPNATIFRKRASNSLMGARAPWHPFWPMVLEAANHGWGITKHQRILSSAGPQAVDRGLAKWRRKWPKNSKTREEVRMLPQEIFNPCSVCNRSALKAIQQPGVLAAHVADGSWHNPCSAMVNTVYCDWYYFVAIGVLAVVATTFIVLYAKCRGASQ